MGSSLLLWPTQCAATVSRDRRRLELYGVRVSEWRQWRRVSCIPHERTIRSIIMRSPTGAVRWVAQGLQVFQWRAFVHHGLWSVAMVAMVQAPVIVFLEAVVVLLPVVVLSSCSSQCRRTVVVDLVAGAARDLSAVRDAIVRWLLVAAFAAFGVAPSAMRDSGRVAPRDGVLHLWTCAIPKDVLCRRRLFAVDDRAGRHRHRACVRPA